MFTFRSSVNCSPRTLCFLALPALLLAGDPGWKTKPVPGWTQEDARQILTDSPWARTVRAGLARRQNEDERRDSGDMGQPHGVGYDGVGQKQVRPRLPDSLTSLTKGAYKAPPPEFITVQVRWETAFPVRAAELKAGEIEPPTLEGAGYRIAVYGIPGPYVKGDPATVGEPLKKAAAIRREGKKDVRPFRAEVFEAAGGMVVVYLFPLNAEIGRNDGLIEFDAQIGRVVVKQSFDVKEMEFQGRLEL